MLLSGATHEKESHPPGYYHSLALNTSDVNTLTAKEIKKDLKRSFPEHPAFKVDIQMIKLKILYPSN
jgi:hypothetical protein